MSYGKPLALVIEFDDASKTSVSFEALPYHLQCELLRQPFASRPRNDCTVDRFVLMEWEDGWKEVTKVGEGCTSIGRYYVISRPEEVGRLALVNGNGYPELIEVTRKPSSVSSITFLGTFHLIPRASCREGKKTDHLFDLSEGDSALTRAAEDLRRALEEENIDPEDLRNGDWSEQRQLYERLRRKMGIAAAYKQQDTYDFIAHLMQMTGLT
jgi:hypothetical protein